MNYQLYCEQVGCIDLIDSL